MQAQAVWAMWRRILREPELAEWALGDAPADDPRLTNMSADELEILRAYAGNKVSTRFFVENYRFRLASSALNALETAGPLTRRAITSNGNDLDAMITELLESTGWRDFGPNVYTFGALILEYLASRPDVAAIAGIPDLIRLELAATGITMAAARSTANGAQPATMARWRLNPWLRLVTCDLDLAGWLRAPVSLGRVRPAAGPRQFAVFLPSLEARARVVALPSSAAALLALLIEHGRLTAEQEEESQQLLTELSRMGLIWPNRAGSRC
ncbi:MAG TPA: hypothetical protein VFI65_03590 [Streptosporangiaceae bacterium]|nr:hypothetical protein [Streptosporangiaceae bacterium]